jgi:hypothetical protein
MLLHCHCAFFTQTPPFFLVSTKFLRGWFTGDLLYADESLLTAPAREAQHPDCDSVRQESDATMSTTYSSANASAAPSVQLASIGFVVPHPPLEWDFNDSLLCLHGCVDPLKVDQMKRVTPACWQAIRGDGYQSATELSHHKICFECAATQIDSSNRAEAKKQDRLDLASALDASKDEVSGFAVSELFIRLWKDEAIKLKPDFAKLPAQINSDILCDCGAGSCGNSTHVPFRAFSAKLRPVDVKAGFVFVCADLWTRLCQSDKRFSNSMPTQRVSTSEHSAKRQKTSSELGLVAARNDDLFCVNCRLKFHQQLNDRIELDNVRDQERRRVSIPISSFADQFPLAVVQTGTYCIIPQSWFQRWSAFIRHGSGRRPDSPSDFDEHFLCKHKKLCYAPWPINSNVAYCGELALGMRLHSDAGEIRLLTLLEFKHLQSIYPNLGSPIEVVFSRKDRGSSSGSGPTSIVAWSAADVTTRPAICLECAEKRLRVRFEQSLRFQKGCLNLVPADSFKLRTTRQNKGVITLNQGIHSQMSVQELKMHLMGLDLVGNVAHISLSFRGNSLTDMQRSLFDYRIPNGSTIQYAIDKANCYAEECDDVFEFGSNRKPERGFANSNFFKSS